jgi:hypothetical protein
MEDAKTALKNATTLYRQTAADLQNEKNMEPKNSESIKAAQRAFDEAGEKLSEALKADVMARNLGGKRMRRRRATKRRRHRRSSRVTRKQK